MIGSGSLIAQHRPLQILDAILAKGAVPHALLFTGLEGVGKRTAALAFAKALNCSGVRPYPSEDAPSAAGASDRKTPPAFPCGVCRSCRKIESGNHPDILSVKPIGPFIRIDQIRELCGTLAMKPYEAEYRVAVISHAESMNAEAGNALLKMLEEPPDRTILILTATTAADMLPTIVSRCRHIRFQPVPVSLLADELVKRLGVDPASARGLAVLAGGSLSKALSLPGTNWIKRRKWLLGQVPCLAFRPGESIHPVRLLAVASVLSEDRDLAMDALEILKTVYRDLLIYPHQPENLMNPDAGVDIARASACMNGEEIAAAVRAIDQARERIRGNAGVRPAMETLFLTLAKYPEMN